VQPAQPHAASESAAPTGAAARFASRWYKFAETVAAAMFAAVFLIFNYKIITRYFEHDEAVWADEVSVILFIWIIFWANAFIVADRQQIAFDLVYRPLPERVKRGFALARMVLIGGIFVWALPGSIDYILFLWRERTAVLELRLDYVYACFGIFLISVVVRSVWSIWRLLGPHWRDVI
jgi:TRAP-type C4-dicarboxylate transport system permease small subunit